ncbi:MAG: 3-methyl-2-oxobutanoate hydroxymethyltransferase [Anaerolineales bacterium]|nr:3-methyl-2-oxobutanoate hydroxymethyltransferase [Anaerolineales bacterium]
MEKVTIQLLHEMKQAKNPITMITAYDYSSGIIADRSGVEMVLVGDSVGMVVHGFSTTLPVTMDMMVMHCQAVRRGVQRAFLIGDMPFLSYQTSIEDAKRNAGRLLAEGGADAIKLEGGRPMIETIRQLVTMGIAVQGHIGLTPQSVSAFDGFKAQGKDIESARRLVEDAQALVEAGVFSIVLEAIPAKLAALIAQRVSVPTIGIGAGNGCDGQVLVLHDLLGLVEKTPKFVKRYADMAQTIQNAIEAYRDEVRERHFPTQSHSFSLDEAVWKQLEDEFGA